VYEGKSMEGHPANGKKQERNARWGGRMQPDRDAWWGRERKKERGSKGAALLMRQE